MRSRACLIMVLAAAIAAATAGTAHAEFRYTSTPFDTSGSLTITWHGDPAAGCATAGLCGYRGTTTYPVARRGFLESLWDGRELIDVSGELDLPGRSTTRVTRDVPGGDPAVCVDRGHGTFFYLDVRHAYRDRYSVELADELDPGAIASGRCAGPTLSDVGDSLPSAVFRLDRIKRPGARINLAGRFPFHAGPLVGEVVSTLQLRSRRSRTKVEHEDGRPPHGERDVFVDLSYAVKRLSAAIGVDFHATQEGCEAIDACGAMGSERYEASVERGRLDVFAIAPWHRRGKPSLRRALQHIAKHGFIFGSSELPQRGRGETASTFALPGLPACSDRLDPGSTPPLFFDGRRGKLALALGFGADESSGDAFDDVLVGRCPGPTQAQVFGAAPFARMRLPVSALTRKRLDLLLRAAGSFSRRGYAGTRRTRVDASLERTSAHVSVERGEGGSIAVIGTSPGGGFRQRP